MATSEGEAAFDSLAGTARSSEWHGYRSHEIEVQFPQGLQGQRDFLWQ